MQQQSQHIKAEITKGAAERQGANNFQDSDKSSRTHSGRFGSERNKSDQGSIEDVNLFGHYDEDSVLLPVSDNNIATLLPKSPFKIAGSPEKPRERGVSFANGETPMHEIYENSDSSSSSTETEDEQPAELDNSLQVAASRKRRNTVSITGATKNTLQ